MTTDTKAVARWDWDSEDMNEYPDGDYVLFTDHERVVGELQWEGHKKVGELADEIDRLRAALAASHAEVAKLEERACCYLGVIDGLNHRVVGLKKDAERRLDLIRATVENSEWRHGARNIYGELRREIQSAEAAMENGNV